MNLANIWIANSLYTKSHIISKSKTNKVNVLYNYIDFDFFENKLSKAVPNNLILKNRFSVVMLGGINPWKNQIEFVNVALKVLKKSKNINFYMFGKVVSEEYYKELKEKIYNENCDKNIFFCGYEKSVEKVYKSSDLMLHTSLVEPFGRVFIESLAAGVPIIANGNGGAKEIVKNGIHGYIFDQWNTNVVADSVLHLEQNEGIRKAW